MNRKLTIHAAAALTLVQFLLPGASQADPVSPHIGDGGRTYSLDAPNSTFYGTGVGGNMTEASELRFEVERLVQLRRYEEAIVKAKKAVQLDPADPQTHLILARALTKRFYAKQGQVDEKLLSECLVEWRLIWHHDADQIEQTEAKWEARKLDRIARTLAKEKLQKEKDQQVAKAALAEQRAAEGKPAAAEGKQIAIKKKRFLLF